MSTVTLQQALAIARDHFQAMRLADAETLGRQILHAVPDQLDTLFLLGQVAQRRGQHEEALPLFRRILTLRPEAWPVAQAISRALVDLGRLNEAEGFLRGILAAYPNNGEACCELGRVFALQGQRDRAVDQFSRAVPMGVDIFAFSRLEPNASLRAIVLQAIAPYNQRFADIWRDCAILGRYGPTLSRDKEDIIKSILDSHYDLWSTGQTPDPFRSNLYNRNLTTDPLVPGENPRHKTKVLMIFAQYINCRDEFIDCEFVYHMATSAHNCGLDPYVFYADDIAYGMYKDISAADLEQKLANLRAMILEIRPEVIMFDGNYIGAENTIRTKFWSEIRSHYDFKLINLVADCSDQHPDYLGYWGGVCDRSIIYHQMTKHCLTYHNPKKIYLGLGLPFDEYTFAPGATEKDIGFLFIGSPSRGRNVYLAAVQESGIDCHVLLHDRKRTNCPDLSNYANLLKRSRVTFNTGYNLPGNSILTGRVTESILAKILLLEETNNRLERFFVPFVHFVPVSNVHQVVSFTQFFLKHEDYRFRMVNDAHRWMMEHYSSARFWNSLLSTLGDDTRIAW